MSTLPDPLMQAVYEARKRDYGAGLTDGVKIALKMLLGHESETGGPPFKGALSDEARNWAEAVLANMDADEVAAALDEG